MPGRPLTFAVILSGCGVYDGAEIHEAVLTLLAIDRQGARYRCYAPNVAQHHVVNHLTGHESAESRNVLVESARIARGKIEDLAGFRTEDADVVIFPGGFGAAKNLSSFAFDGAACTINPDVARVVRAMAGAGKPVGALCISPVILAKLLAGSTVTIGNDADTAAAIVAMGSHHTVTSHGGVVIDRQRRLVTSPCYMLNASVSQIAEGADNAVRALIALAAR